MSQENVEVPQVEKPSTEAIEREPLVHEWFIRALEAFEWPFLALMLVLAFFLGSFAATNHDALMHLATGRAFADGTYQFGVDPFSYTTEPQAKGDKGIYWANHSWLPDWAGYLLYSGSGGLLVVLKALLLAGLASILLWASRCSIAKRGSGAWVAIFCITLTVLSVSPRWILNPNVLSYFLFAATLTILARSGVFATDAGKELDQERYLWALPVIFLIWVNVDEWFLLGPIVVFVCAAAGWVGKMVGRQATVEPGRLALIGVAGLAICLCNPHHVHAFVLPPELGYLLGRIAPGLPDSILGGGRTWLELEKAESVVQLTLSPLSSLYVSSPELGGSFAGYCFFVMLGLALFSVVLLQSARSFPQVPSISAAAYPLLVLFGLLALLLGRMIPFFAITAGLLSMLHLQDFLEWRESYHAEAAERHRLWATLGRIVLLFGLPALVFLSWPGWLSGAWGDAASNRRVAWRVEIDPSLRAAATYLGTQHQQKQLNRVFNLTSPIASYCAWFAPQVKCFFDSRYALFPIVTSEYLSARLGLYDTARQKILGAQPLKERDWRSVLTRFRVDHIVNSGYQTRLTSEKGKDVKAEVYFPVKLMCQWSWMSEPELVMVYGDGASFAWFWKGGSLNTNPIGLPERWMSRAFAPALETPFWSTGVPPLETDPGFWKNFAFGRPPSAPALAEVDFLLDYFQFRSMLWRFSVEPTWLVTGGARQAIQPMGFLPIDASCALNVLIPRFVSNGVRPRDAGPPDASLLAMRAARAALAQNPKDPAAYRTLANAVRVLGMIEELHWSGQQRPHLLQRIRKVEYLSAVKNAVKLRPEDPDLHWLLAQFFLQEHFLDAALEHLSQSVRYLNQQAPPVKGDRRHLEYLQEKAVKEKELHALEAEVKARLQNLELYTTRRNDFEKFNYALRLPYQFTTADGKQAVDPRGMGLAQVALNLLQRMSTQSLPPEVQMEVVRSQIRLMLQLGDIAQTADSLAEGKSNEGIKMTLGDEHAELSLFVAAAVGNYEQLDRALAEIEKANDRMRYRSNIQLAIAAVTAPLSASLRSPMQIPVHCIRETFGSSSYEVVGSETRLVRGLMRLETGNTIEARKGIEEALEMGSPYLRYPDRLIGVRYLELLDQAEKAVHTKKGR